jgi:hypothetical protein
MHIGCRRRRPPGCPTGIRPPSPPRRARWLACRDEEQIVIEGEFLVQERFGVVLTSVVI